MKTLFTRIGFVSLGFAALVVFAGCQSNGSKPASTAVAATSDYAVSCDKCSTVWVKSPQLNSKGFPIPFAYTYKQTAVCPDCQKAAEKYFATGVLDKCPTCGDSLKVVEASKM
jgi:hypothetical protein